MTRKIAVLGTGAIGSSAVKSNRIVREEIVKWARVIREAGIQAE